MGKWYRHMAGKTFGHRCMCKPNKVGAAPKFDKRELFERREAISIIRQLKIDDFHRQLANHHIRPQ